MSSGVNKQIIDRLEDVGALAPLTRAEVEAALNSPDNHTRALRSIELIRKLWLSEAGLGVPPIIDLVQADEQDHAFYPGYRDHIVHTFQVYLLGLDIIHGQPDLREYLEQGRVGSRFLRQWKVASLAHDHGYGAEVKGRFQVPERLRQLLNTPLSAFQTTLSAGVQSRLGDFLTTPHWGSDFLDQLLDFRGEPLLDRITQLSGNTTLGTGTNPVKDYYDFVKEQGFGGRDHGIMGVLILLQLHRRLRAQLQGIDWASLPQDALSKSEKDFLQNSNTDLKEAVEDIDAGCAAIALHNIRRDQWTQHQIDYAAANFNLRLNDFRIDLSESPLAWFLAFCDTIQCWNRPQAIGNAKAEARYYPDDQVSIEHEQGRVWISFLDERDHLVATGESRQYRLRLELVEYLDTKSVDAVLGFGGSGAMDPDPLTVHLESITKVGRTETVRQLTRLPRNWAILEEIDVDTEVREIQRRIYGYEPGYPEMLPVCVLYTGGSVGMVPMDEADRESPLITKGVEHVVPYLGRLRELPFDIHFWQTPDPLDSSNIRPDDWFRMAKIIQHLYQYYQGFVILHGTDTMAYTASALSFIFKNLAKPVILTGAERPIAQLVTDAVPNIMNALQVAAPEAIGKPLVPEVCIYFGGRLIRGNRSKKTHSLAFAGFDSPNCELLGTVEDKIDIHASVLRPVPVDSTGRRQDRALELTVDGLDPRVAIYEIYPSMDPCLDVMEYMLTKSDQVRAIVLKTYGTGNAPTLPERFLEVVEAGVKTHRKIIVNVTSCPVGQVEVRLFETNARLFELGVINGGDMTAEAAFTKLIWLLAKHAHGEDIIDMDAVARQMQIDLRGELRFSVFNLLQKDVELTSEPYSPRAQYIGEIEPDKINHAYLRVHGIKLTSSVPKEFSLRLYFQCPQASLKGAARHKKKMIGEVKRTWGATAHERRDGITFNLDATQIVRGQLVPKEELSIQIVPMSDCTIQIETVELAIFTENRTRVG